jgi:predicted urease superfamily metal-dependent hydrolase
MTTTENNKLIAEFMDLTIKEGVCYYTDADDMYPMGIEVEEPYIPYDESWDWLHKVIDKCFKVAQDGDMIDIMHHLQVSDRDATYNAVIEFINFYNKK